MIQFYEEKELENITKHFNDFTERFEPEAFEIFKDWIQIPSLKDLENKKQIPYWLAYDTIGKG